MKNKFKTHRENKMWRVMPLAKTYGKYKGAGNPIDRYYIEKFLAKNKSDIKGAVLEIFSRRYTVCFGVNKVDHSDVLDVDASNKNANIYADLRDKKALPKKRYDCIILTQTLQYIDDLDAAIGNLYRMLKDKGVLLCTLPSVSRIDPRWIDFWRFTKASAQYIFEKHFAKDKLQIRSYGNVYVDICFLYAASWEELTKEELEYNDKYFPLIVCARAVK